MNPQEIRIPQVQWLKQLADDMKQLNSDKIEMAKGYYSSTGLKSDFGLLICQMYDGIKKSHDREKQAEFRGLRQDYICYLKERIEALQGKVTTLQDPWCAESKIPGIVFPNESCHLHDVLEAGKLVAKYKLSDQVEDLDREFKDLVEKIRIVYGEKIHKGDNFVEALLTLIDVSRRHFLSSSFDEGMQVISEAEQLMREFSCN